MQAAHCALTRLFFESITLQETAPQAHLDFKLGEPPDPQSLLSALVSSSQDVDNLLACDDYRFSLTALDGSEVEQNVFDFDESDAMLLVSADATNEASFAEFCLIRFELSLWA